MVVGAFPLAKLAVIAIRQISKPLSNKIKESAKSSHFFRTYVCMPPAQFYHWVEINIKMKMLNLGKPSEVQPLNEAMAIDLGAELLGESTIFIIAVGCMAAEYIRSSRKEARKEQDLQNLLERLQYQIKDLGIVVGEQDARIRNLSRPAGTKIFGSDPPADTPSPKLIEIINKPIEKLASIEEMEKKQQQEKEKAKILIESEKSDKPKDPIAHQIRLSILEKAIKEAGILFISDK